MTAVRVGTWNAFDKSADVDAQRGLTNFATEVDVAGLQEFGGPVRRQMLRDLPGFDFYKPRSVSAAPPIIWREDVFELLHGSTPLVAYGRRVGVMPGFKTTLPDYYATVCLLMQHPTEQPVVVGNIHTPAHVEKWPGLRRYMYIEAVSSLVSYAQAVAGEAPIFLVGDWNWNLTPTAYPVRLMAARGLRIAWAAFPAARGTHGKRVIDGVFSTLPATDARVLGIRVGDHRPAVATYDLPPEVPAA